MQTFTNEPFLEPIVRRFRFHKILKHIAANSVVVDIGCGHTPHLLNRLEPYIKSGVGLDPLISSKIQGKIKLTSCLLGDKVPIKSRTVDYVTLSAVLEHLDDPSSILSECFRILKRGGKVLLTTPTPLNKPLLEFLSFRLGLISTREIAEHKSYFWAEELRRMLRRAGFKNISHTYFELFLNNFVIAQK